MYITSYHQALNYASKARNARNGRPLSSCSRIRMVGGGVASVTFNGAEVFRIRPDNTLVFVLPVSEIRANSNTLSMAMNNVIPFSWTRIATGRYKIVPWDNHDYNWRKFAEDKSRAPEYFEGLTFDLTTGKALNAKPDLKDRVIPEKRTEWLRALRKWKRGFRTRAKVGVLDGLIAKLDPARRLPRGYRNDFMNEEQLDILYSCIKNNEHPTELLIDLVDYARLNVGGYYGKHTELDGKAVADAVDNLFKEISIPLRKRFGVFADD